MPPTELLSSKDFIIQKRYDRRIQPTSDLTSKLKRLNIFRSTKKTKRGKRAGVKNKEKLKKWNGALSPDLHNDKIRQHHNSGPLTPPLPSSPLWPSSPVLSSSSQSSTPLLQKQKKQHHRQQQQLPSSPSLSYQNNLKVLTVNCRSIVGKRAEFHALIEQHKPHIICGQESWLNNSIKSCEIFPKEYEAFRNDRILQRRKAGDDLSENEDGEAKQRGGGVFILVDKKLTGCEQVKFQSDCEIIWVTVKLQGHKDILIGSFYMPHRNETDITELQKSLGKINAESQIPNQIILTGDFNCPDINWNNSETSSACPQRNVQQGLIEITTEAQLTQIHEECTRGDNILDLVFVSNPSLVYSSTSQPGISDHACVITETTVKPNYSRQPPRKRYLFKRANWNSIQKRLNRLSSEIAEQYKSGMDVNEMWNHFHSCLLSTINEFIPQKVHKKTRTPPWMNNKIKALLRRKAKAFKRAKLSRTWDTYKALQRESRREIRQAEWTHINNVIERGLETHNTKPFWNYIKSKKNDSIGVAPLKENGILCNEGKDKARILLDQFKSVFTPHDSNNTAAPPTSQRCDQSIMDITISTSGVEKLLKNIDPSKAPGPDDIPNTILKECAESLAPSLSIIFQKSIDTGMLPNDWLKANIAPVFKKGNKNKAENYRPISLTSVTSKLLEHIICKNMMNHFETNDILTDLNHGFRKGYSCESQLLITLNDLLKHQNANIQTDIGILDFSKAFDTVPHQKLLHKLENYGIRGSLHTWLSNFLTKRTMKVVIDSTSSNECPVISGVPQGTVLGPILFLCFINDLPQRVKSQIRLFADDCLIYRPIRSPNDQKLLQEDLDNLEKWASDWGMKFNADKCYILSTSKKHEQDYKLNNIVLKQVDDNPYLGITFSKDLKWGKHISKITQKANSTLAFLRRNLSHASTTCKRNAYLSLVRSQLEYGAVAWDPYLKEDIQKLERVQRQGARFITGNYKTRTPGCMTQMLQERNLTSLQQRRKETRLSFMFKITRDQIPSIKVDSFFTPRPQKRKIRAINFENHVTENPIERYTTNNSNCFNIPPSKTQNYRNSFFVRTVSDWNCLDELTVMAPHLDDFKARLTRSRAQ